MATPNATPKAAPAKATESKPMTQEERAGLQMAIGQLDMLIAAFASAPEKVKKSAEEFRGSLQGWADGKL